MKIKTWFLLLSSAFIVISYSRNLCADRVDDFINSRKVAISTNDFGIRVFKKMLDGNDGKNIIISPSSLSTVLTMLTNGTQKKTHKELLKTLGLKHFNKHQINGGSSELRKDITYENNNSLIKVSNSIWASDLLAINKDFKSASKLYYDVDIETRDFKNPQTLKEINNRIEKNSREKNKNNIDNIEILDCLYIINTLYFKMDWKIKFAKTLTAEKEFHLSNGKTEKVSMMKKTSLLFNYYKTESFQAVALDYERDKAKMYVFLPENNLKLNDFIKILDAKILKEFSEHFQRRKGTVELPKFNIEKEKIDLTPFVKATGIKRLFEDKADLTFIDMGDAHFSKILQTANIKVDEDGTVASSATTGIAVLGDTNEEPFHFVADRPFLFVICDNRTHAILFMGKVESPGKFPHAQ